MYFLPVNVAINFHENRLISSFNPDIKDGAEFFIPLGHDVPVEAVVAACSMVRFPEKFDNEHINAAKVLSSLINSFIFCRVARANVGETNSRIIYDLARALNDLYHYKEIPKGDHEWQVVRNKKRDYTAKKWIDMEITKERKQGDIVRKVLPYAIFIRGGTNDFGALRDDFEEKLSLWLSRIRDPERARTLSLMYTEYLSYF